MPDKMDYVAGLQDKLNTSALAAHQAAHPPSVKDSLDDCINCGDLIPSARQVAVPGCELCTECATFQEQRGRLP